MKTLLLTNHYSGEPLNILKQAVADHFQLVTLERADRDCLLSHIGQADYLLVSGRLQIDSEVLSRADKLKMIQRTGVGLDNMDLDYIESLDIPLYVNAGVNSDSVAEHTIMLILNCLKRNYEINCNMRNHIWNKQQTGVSCHELKGKRVGLIGAGAIGRRVAEILNVFGADVNYYDVKRLDEAVEQSYQLTYVPFDELISSSDIISLHCPYDKASGAVITERELSQMKRGAILINTARGKLIDEKALCDALDNGHIAAAGIDVYETEPVPAECALLKKSNVNITPHIAGVSYEAFSSMMRQAVGNIIAFDDNRLDEIEQSRFRRRDS